MFENSICLCDSALCFFNEDNDEGSREQGANAIDDKDKGQIIFEQQPGNRWTYRKSYIPAHINKGIGTFAIVRTR